MKWLTVSVFLTGVLHAQSAKAPDAYTVTETNTMMGPVITMEISRDGNRAVVEQSYPPADPSAKGFHTRVFYDLQKGRSYTVNLAETPPTCGAANFSGDWGDPFGASGELATLSPKDVGAATVNGMAAKILEVTIPGQQGASKVWVEGKTGLMLKLEMGGKTVVEIKKVSFAKPPASALALPAACAGVTPPPTEAETIAASTGGNAADFTSATVAPGTPPGACTVLFRVVRAGSMAPITSGFQVAVDKNVDMDHPAAYKMGDGGPGHATFSGGGMKELTSQLQGGVLRMDDLAAHFDLEMAFGDGHFSGVLLYRQCFGPQTVLLYVIPGTDKLADGRWLWVKSGKYASVPPRP